MIATRGGLIVFDGAWILGVAAGGFRVRQRASASRVDPHRRVPPGARARPRLRPPRSQERDQRPAQRHPSFPHPALSI